VAFIERMMSHSAGGFVEALPPELPRRQNPHMHLLEACLVWRAKVQDSAFSNICGSVVDLFQKRFFYSKSGSLVEHFADDLQPLAEGVGLVVEPGHLFEWDWLLCGFMEASAERDRLYDFARRYGINDRNRLLFAALSPEGSPLDEACRLWPHAEWLKAELVRPSIRGSARPVAAFDALSRFLETKISGLYYERWDPVSAGFRYEPSPASSLYHITCAFSELLAHDE
jgi:mannose/cellobiose epimerase-like protein (N-acyl-D-glucosamine 2-epimerase family)